MTNQINQIDRVFQALADPTRRAILERLSYGSVAMSELAQPFSMTLPSFSQHLNVLERCELVNSRKSGRVRTYQLTPEPLQGAQDWLVTQRANWQLRLNQLDFYLSNLKEQKP